MFSNIFLKKNFFHLYLSSFSLSFALSSSLSLSLLHLVSSLHEEVEENGGLKVEEKRSSHAWMR